MIQKYIKEIDKGDRRLIVIDGEYCGSVARIPKDGDIKANFHAGGVPSKTDLVFRDKEIIDVVGPQLRENNLLTVPAADNILRLAPPLIVKYKEIDKSILIIKKVLGNI